jgi:hypothetical protein
MGFFTSIFSDRDDSGSTRIREDNEDRSKVTGDKITYTKEDSKSEHEHSSYTLDRASGSYKEYYGGEHSDDRSYNK